MFPITIWMIINREVFILEGFTISQWEALGSKQNHYVLIFINSCAVFMYRNDPESMYTIIFSHNLQAYYFTEIVVPGREGALWISYSNGRYEGEKKRGSFSSHGTIKCWRNTGLRNYTYATWVTVHSCIIIQTRS